MTNDAYVDHWYVSLDKPNPAFSIVTERGLPCPLVASKTSGKVCGKEVDDRHIALCRTCMNGPIVIHDGVTQSHLVPELKVLGLSGLRVKERTGLCVNRGEQIRPADVWWTESIVTWLQGIDYAVIDPLRLNARLDKRGLTISAKNTGTYVAQAEARKLKTLSSTRLRGGNWADSVIRPFVVGITGGMGKEALSVLLEWSKVAHPGDDDDHATRKARAVYRSRFMKRHAFALARIRYDTKLAKFEMIRDAFFFLGGEKERRWRNRLMARPPSSQRRRDVEGDRADEHASVKAAAMGGG